jgi:hypothetical protein
VTDIGLRSAPVQGQVGDRSAEEHVADRIPFIQGVTPGYAPDRSVRTSSFLFDAAAS